MNLWSAILAIIPLLSLAACRSSYPELGGIENHAQADRRPNIVVLMVDDLGFSDLGCYGGEIDTPRIDALAANGLRYSQFYNCGRCCPTRASLMTGLYPHRAGIGHMTTADYGLPGYRGDLAPHAATVAEVLQGAGYATWMVGKWHIARDFAPEGPRHNWPLQRGFDRFYGTLIAAGSQWDPITLTSDNEAIGPVGAGEDFYYTEAMTDRVLGWLGNRDHDAPFFLYMAPTAPHWPLHAREEVIARYRDRYLAGWDELRRRRLERMVALDLLDASAELSRRDPHVPSWRAVEHREWQASRMAAYAAMVDQVDTAVGRLVDALAARGELDHTLFMILSDNGGASLEHPDGLIGTTGEPWCTMRYVPVETRDGHAVISGDVVGLEPGPEDTYAGYGHGWANLSNAPFRLFKKYSHEGGVAAPLVVHWPAGLPGEAAGELRRDVAHVIDILPTCLAAAGASYPARHAGRPTPDIDGQSLLPSFAGRAPAREAVFFEHAGNRAVRAGHWKLVAESGEPWALHDMRSDRTESRDLSAEQRERVAELESLYAAWAQRCGVEPWATVAARIAGASRGGVVLPGQGNPLRRSEAEIAAAVARIQAARTARGLAPMSVHD